MARKTTVVRFLSSSALSLLGNSVAGIVLPLVLLARTGDALAAGGLALICAVPQMLAGLLGGVLLDRFNRRTISIISDFISAISVALIPVVDMVWGLNFGWFVALGLLGAVGDIPGMTARDTLLPAVTKRDNVDLQQFMGLTQSLDSLITIIGPALAAVLIGFGGEVEALWVTAALSCSAALVTLTIPRSVGAISADENTTDARLDGTPSTSPVADLVRATKTSLVDGVRVLFKNDAILRTSTLLTFGIVMVMGSFQGLILPVHFTETGHPELLGYVLSAMSVGLLVGSLGYAALAPRARKRTWYLISLTGMAAGVGVMGALPTYPLLLVGAALLGLSAGPASALLGFFAYDRIPATRRGSALGTQNALLLIAAPIAMFATSVVVSAASTQIASLALIACWLIVAVWALRTKSMRAIDQACETTTKETRVAVDPLT